ncbi:hypothetical protein B4096_0144 [Heyndrickxia coagulans]|uniref:Uncharacterized protein n=1 Tax=Heyndrickxia coagulans TaxID=1398 RepID=A0A0C5CA75_HEYCO|nr:hypothetical protein SB48_HM08orf04446 [Heyndrickxia coagulans]KWZ77236.1 hypothetical protein HMPREF3213_03425 [Heyndrickxia coagulans]KYC63541.1 hypothetical protein B4100_0192 [Heyndrickxia coagulans]KYC90480.1 hypothetical protein B4096_0144 [Heyndrickxia coagulans]
MEQVYANSNRELLSFLIILFFSQLYYFSFILERKQHENVHFFTYFCGRLFYNGSRVT